MTIEYFLLFIGVLLFAGLNFLVNAYARTSNFLKLFTFFNGIFGILIAVSLIFNSLIGINP